MIVPLYLLLLAGLVLGQGPRGPATTTNRQKPTTGCYHNNMYYQIHEDVISGHIGDVCYGYYCGGDNVFVHWEDNCAQQPAQPPPGNPNHNSNPRMI